MEALEVVVVIEYRFFDLAQVLSTDLAVVVVVEVVTEDAESPPFTAAESEAMISSAERLHTIWHLVTRRSM